MENILPERKSLRLKDFDYSKNGAYFITICTKDRKQLFLPVGADSISARMVKRTFLETIERYDGVETPILVVMPDHFHAIITISRPRWELERADMESAPTTLSEIVQAFKRYSTLEYIKLVRQGLVPPFDKQIWQRGFHDHIIRNRDDFEKVCRYIHENPLRWEYDHS